MGLNRQYLRLENGLLLIFKVEKYADGDKQERKVMKE
jgi:hypothetical protein